MLYTLWVVLFWTVYATLLLGPIFLSVKTARKWWKRRHDEAFRDVVSVMVYGMLLGMIVTVTMSTIIMRSVFAK